MVVEVITSVIL